MVLTLALVGLSAVVTLELRKGEGAQTLLTVRARPGGGSLVEATVGLGVPIGAY